MGSFVDVLILFRLACILCRRRRRAVDVVVAVRNISVTTAARQYAQFE